MSRILAILFVTIVPLMLVACGGGTAPGDADGAGVKAAVAFLSTTEGTPGVFVKGRDIVVSYATRPMGFAESVRKAALDATKSVGGRQIKIYVVDSATVATSIPASGQFYCSVSANDGRIAGNNC